ncbi:MAG: DUF520 family protein, partial [Candidatus Omnitrophica bacterium]|nr:DUF520 family protein [Candidatus Omnitrophota bacterium]
EEATGLLRVSGDHAAQLKSVIDVVETKMAKRGVALKAFAWQSPQMLPSGGVKQAAQLQEGLSSEKAKAIVAAIKVLGLKVQPRIEGDSVRVVGKQVDDLQVVIAALKKEDFGVAIQADNYR